MTQELHVDPDRAGDGRSVGIYVRAVDGGQWRNADISELDRRSLYVWLRSRGGRNLFAEHVVATLLGHPRITE